MYPNLVPVKVAHPLLPHQARSSALKTTPNPVTKQSSSRPLSS